MKVMPLVSVIVPFYNAEKFIAETIESVLAQTYTAWELILADDGSSDSSTQISLDYTRKHPNKIYYIDHVGHQNRGTSATRNLGILKANGKYIATLDADDVWLPNKLDEQVSIMESHQDIDMVFGNTKTWSSWIASKNNNNQDYYEHDQMKSNSLKLNTVINPPVLLILRLSGWIFSPTMSDNMFRKKAIDDVGGFEEIFTGMHDDQVIWAKIFLNSPAYISASCWTLHRRHPESCTSVAKKEGRVRSAELFYLSWLKNYLSENRITDPELLSVLQKRIWLTRHPYLYALSKFKGNAFSRLMSIVKRVTSNLLPLQILHLSLLIFRGKGYRPPVGCVYFGDLSRLTPISNNNGIDRGTSIESYYKAKFFNKFSNDIRGHVLEISPEGYYARKYCGERVIQTSSLDLAINVRNELKNSSLPSSRLNEDFNCIIFIDGTGEDSNIQTTFKILYSHLKPGGVILAMINTPLAQISIQQKIESEYPLSMTSSSIIRLLIEFVPAENIYVSGYGNLLTLTGLFYGLAAEDIKEKDIDFYDPNYTIITGIKLLKPL